MRSRTTLLLVAMTCLGPAVVGCRSGDDRETARAAKAEREQARRVDRVRRELERRQSRDTESDRSNQPPQVGKFQ